MIIFDDEEIDYKVLCSMLVLNSEWLDGKNIVIIK